MLKTLIKKQLTEIFRTFFYNPKKNEARSKAGSLVLLLLFLFILFGILGWMFFSMARSLSDLLLIPETSWFYFTLFALLSTVVGVFGSVFSTYSSLYLAKDNDLILSLPIPVNTIIVSRLSGVYIVGSVYSLTVMLPSLIVFFIYGGATATGVIGSILLTLIVTLFVFILSCLLGFIVAKVSTKLKNKSFITVIISLLFIGAYYLFYFKATDLIAEIIANAYLYGEKVKGNAYPLYLFGRMGDGDVLAMLIFSGAIALLLVLTWTLIKRDFLKTAATAGLAATKEKYKKTRLKQSSPFGALVRKEFRRFTASPQYMLNCGLGLVFLVGAAIYLPIGGEKTAAAITQSFGASNASVLICAAVMLMIATVDVSAPSISLEGKTLWILQSLPVTPWQVLRAKLALHLALVTAPAALCTVFAAAAFDFSLALTLLALLLTLSFCVLCGLFGLFMGLASPNLTWTNEIIPIKNSLSVLVALFGGWAYCVLFGALYFLFDVGTEAYLASGAALNILLSVLLAQYIRTKGAAKLALL